MKNRGFQILAISAASKIVNFLKKILKNSGVGKFGSDATFSPLEGTLFKMKIPITSNLAIGKMINFSRKS